MCLFISTRSRTTATESKQVWVNMLTFNSELEIAFKELFFKYYIFVQPKRITHWPSSEFDFQGSGWGRPQVIQAAFTSRFVDT